jgi:putative acetyltransferase
MRTFIPGQFIIDLSEEAKIMTTVRAEQKNDAEAIDEVTRLAFGQEDECLLIRRIRNSPRFIPDLSLVAVKEGKIVGHILFSPIIIETAKGNIQALSLAPMAVLPAFQNRGIGSELVQEGLSRCRRLDHKIVVVIGHPDYYPRFGFILARPQGLAVAFPVPDEAFMVQELVPRALESIKGTVRYPPEFNETIGGSKAAP